MFTFRWKYNIKLQNDAREKKEEMVHAAMKLWHALPDPEIFAQYQQRFLSIFTLSHF